MERNVFIFHGTDGHADGNWFPWLKQKLVDYGSTVIVPQFPGQDKDSLRARMDILSKDLGHLDRNAILIGHSRGGLFLLRILERLSHSIYAAYFVSASIGIKPYTFYESGFKFAHGYEFDWDNIRAKAKHFFVYHSNNDPYTSLANSQTIAQKVNTKLTLIPNAGHLNAESGFTQFPQLLTDIERIL